jgi:hypothetical protein
VIPVVVVGVVDIAAILDDLCSASKRVSVERLVHRVREKSLGREKDVCVESDACRYLWATCRRLTWISWLSWTLIGEKDWWLKYVTWRRSDWTLTPGKQSQQGASKATSADGRREGVSGCDI